MHVSLLDPAADRSLFELRRQLIRQEVEQVLRVADPEAFADPRLIQLKRVLQDRINAALERRVVEEILITDLVFK